MEIFILEDDKYEYKGVYDRDDKVKVNTIEDLEVDSKEVSVLTPNL